MKHLTLRVCTKHNAVYIHKWNYLYKWAFMKLYSNQKTRIVNCPKCIEDGKKEDKTPQKK